MQSNFAFKLGELKMTNKVHGGVHGGEFLTGKMDFFTITTVVPMDQTNVTTPVADLYPITNVWSSVTIVDAHGVANTYASEAAYVDAFKKQKNLNTLLNVFGLRANPVALSVVVENKTVSGLGGDYNGNTMKVATINIATEKTGVWYADGQGNFGTAADETNAFGFMLAAALQGVAVEDLASGVIDPNAFETVDTDSTNTVVERRVLL